MFAKVSDFIQHWESESVNTYNILKKLTDDSLTQKVYDEGRSVKDIAWHIVLSIGEMMGKMGINAVCPSEDESAPAKASEIAEIYMKAAKSLSDIIQKEWADERLLDESNMYGEMWKNGKTLLILIIHQTHHRGQLTILMRQAGVKVPGVCGPSKEEWAQYGMKPMK